MGLCPRRTAAQGTPGDRDFPPGTGQVAESLRATMVLVADRGSVHTFTSSVRVFCDLF